MHNTKPVNPGPVDTEQLKADLLRSMMGENSEEEEVDDEPSTPTHLLDFSLMDNLTEFLYHEEDPLSILCGYFKRIMDELLAKQKSITLRYLLIEQNGKIFDGLLKHL